MRFLVKLMFVFVLLFSGFIACKQSKNLYKETTNVLKVERLTFQEEVPGSPDIKPSYYLTVDFENLDDIVIDSIYCGLINFRAISNSVTKEELRNNTLRKQLKKINSITFLNEWPKGEAVTIYFRKKEHLYSHIVTTIERADPIYLP